MKLSAIKKGMVRWLPCKVRKGPFPNERMVYINTGISEWFGFVNIAELKSKVEEGDDSVRAIVLAVEGDTVTVGIRGSSPASGAVQARRSVIAEYGSVSA
jgi:hypothetical protein